ncbi:MAG: DNA repair exonuclease [bacterium]|nr:DNA repair exonuclease [bacterium]
MTTVRFLHVADTHIGCKTPAEFGSARELDFLRAFAQCVELAIKENVDVVLHSGDLFHGSSVSPQLLVATIELLKKLKKEGIPFIAIKGNHDIRGIRKVSAFDILRAAELLQEPGLRDPVKLESAGLAVYGISEQRLQGKELKEYYSKVLQGLKSFQLDDGAELRVLLTHTVPKIYAAKELYQDPRYLPADIYPVENFDYIALGHYHIAKKPKRIKRAVLALPGSTEYTEISKKELSREKYVFLVAAKNGNITVRKKKIKTRNFQFWELQIDSEETLKKLEGFLRSIPEEAFAKVIVFLRRPELRARLRELWKLYGQRAVLEVHETAAVQPFLPGSSAQLSTLEELVQSCLEEATQGCSPELQTLFAEVLQKADELSGESFEHWLRRMFMPSFRAPQPGRTRQARLDEL